ncbi:MAG TPA: hypothetical protein VMK05_02805 [Burkholderiales bacterium]|nr:hypothetical protein [Burkholderiales bacterium]
MSKVVCLKHQESVVHARSISIYDAGFADGIECRKQGQTPSRFVLIAIDDAYSSGFKAGFFERGRDQSGLARHRV